MTCPRLIALAIAASGVVYALPSARADDRPVDDPVDPDEPAHAVVRPPGETPTTTPTPPPAPPPPPKRKPTGTFQIGAGYHADEGFIATSRIEQPKLFGSDHGLALSAAISKLRQDFVMEYWIPKLGDGWDLHTDLAARRRQYPGFVRESAGGSLTLGNQIGRSTRVFFRYRAEAVTVIPDEGSPLDPMARRLAGTLGNGTLSALGAGIQYDTRDSTILPLTGTRFELYGERAHPELGSDFNFTKLAAKLDHATPLGPFTLRLAGRATYVKSHVPGGVPLSERLFHDGYSDIRGYSLGSLDLWDRGANFEALGRVELELPVWKRAGLSIAGFFDAGYRENHDREWGPIGAALHRSVGASLIWRSPIGPLRFDVAFPLDGADRDRQFIFGVGFGF